MESDPSRPDDRLDSWKAIADYLQRDVATARRWEADGLPVRRVAGKRGGSVFAYRHEIDEWLNTSEQPEQVDPRPPAGSGAPPWAKRWRLAMAAIGIAAVVGAMALVWRSWHAAPAVATLHVAVTENGVIATDDRQRELWAHSFDSDYIIGFSGYGTRSQIVPAEPSRVFVATGARTRRSDEVTFGGELQELSARGSVLRTFGFDDTVTFDHKTYGPPWVITTFAVDDRGGSRRIAIAGHHFQWSASMVTILDDHWNRLGTYWQWGWIEALHWLDADRLLIGGFNDARDGGSVAILDAAHLNGQSPETPGAHGFCSSCGPDLPLRMIVMPRTELNKVTVSRFNRAVIQMLPDRIVARTIEVSAEGGAAVDALYELSGSLDVLRASFGGPYWDVHAALYARGQVAHDRLHCPDRAGPPAVMTWDRTTGWRTVTPPHGD